MGLVRTKDGIKQRNMIPRCFYLSHWIRSVQDLAIPFLTLSDELRQISPDPSAEWIRLHFALSQTPVGESRLRETNMELSA